jgi:RimJ/RimL family protein N-acetyltransferase
MTQPTPPPADLLPWDTEFFGFRIGRVHPGRFDPIAIDAWRRENHIRCLYYQADLADTVSIHSAETLGFQFMDLRSEFFMPLPHTALVNLDFDIRRASLDDLPAIRRISTGIFTNSRFYRDPHFSRSRLDEMYNIWVEKHLRTLNTGLWVAEGSGGIVGFVTANEISSLRVQISLLGVVPAYRGKGLALSLNNTVINHYSGLSFTALEAITQASNHSTFQLNFRCGMKLVRQPAWYHGWFDDSPSERLTT